MDFEQSLQTIIFDLMLKSKYIFYGLYLAELNKFFSDDFPTACVSKHPSSPAIALTIGKDFWEKTLWNPSRKKAILIHELEHIVREHIPQMGEGAFPDKRLANIAMDIAINQDITEELPRIDENGEKCGVYIEDFPELGLEAHQSSYYYYNKLQAAKDKKAQSKGFGEDSKAGPKGNGRGTSGSKRLDEYLDAQEDGKLKDWHSLWDELTKGMNEIEKDLFKKEMQETIKRVAEETAKTKGEIPAHIADALKNNFGNKAPIISWKTLFNRFIGSTITTEIYQTRKRPNFRFEDAPSNKYKNKVKIVVGLDTSGSVSDHELQEFFGQVLHMYKAGVDIDVCLWDAACDEPYKYKGEKTYKRTRGGGTQASCFIEYVNKHKAARQWTCAITLTDGYIEHAPIKSNLPMLWVITSNGSTAFEHHCKKIKLN